MSYRCGTGGSVRIGDELVRLPERSACIVCDECGRERSVQTSTGLPCEWFIVGRAAPGWKMKRSDDGARRFDWCPGCKDEVTP